MNSILTEAMHAEWTKLRTVRSTAWLLATMTVLTVGISAIAVGVVKCPASCAADTTKTSLTGVMLGQAIVAVLAVLVMSGEYSTGMIRATITATPRRLVLLSAKAIILTAVVLTVAAVCVLGSLLAGRFLLPRNGFTRAADFVPLLAYHGPTLRAAVGSVLYLGLIALFSLGVATAVRDSGIAITVMLGLIYIVPIFGGLVLSAHWRRIFGQYAPTNAGLAIQVTKDFAAQPIGPWAGLGVLAGWTAAALLVGSLLLKLRDA
ncbi:MAG TPA: ABC transporter permease [Streptosporangiaceae bacterium]|nr:ABC transporter permease [Streptosporangiaceae bacterium]